VQRGQAQRCASAPNLAIIMRVMRLRARLVAAAAVAAVIGLSAPAANGNVLVVGDSLEVGTGPHLKRELADVSVTIDARIARPSAEGVDTLRKRLRSDHEVVVFDLGINDNPAQPETLTRDLEAARELMRGRCLVVVTLISPPINGVSTSALNLAVVRFAAETPNAQLVDWRAAAESDRSLLRPDGLHATAAGYQRRAELVAEGITGCQTLGADDPPPDDPPPLPDTPAPEVVGSGIDWLAVARLRPVSLAGDLIGAGERLLASVTPELGQALAPTPAEPVLGAP
jgi:lysophospholipase L1-like esterase